MATATETKTLVDLENEVIVLNITILNGCNLHAHGFIAGRVRIVRSSEIRAWIGEFCLPPFAEVKPDGPGAYLLRFNAEGE